MSTRYAAAKPNPVNVAVLRERGSGVNVVQRRMSSNAA